MHFIITYWIVFSIKFFSFFFSSQDFSETFVDDFTGLEGATGGSDFATEDMNNQFRKIHRLSESSNDSGIVYNAFSSTASSSASSSSYTGSPHSDDGNGSISSNDTDFVHSINAHHIAHNHTYNTLPGQIPREVRASIKEDHILLSLFTFPIHNWPSVEFFLAWHVSLSPCQYFSPWP